MSGTITSIRKRTSLTFTFPVSGQRSIRTSTSRCCTRFVAQDIPSVTALLDRVAKAASTTAFGLSALAVAFFLFAAAIVVGFLFWQTNRLLTDQVLGTLTAEARILSSEMKGGGQSKLAETVSALSRPQGMGLY